MELRHLKYFVAVAEALHFGRAAAKLRIAQPTLSYQIARLEAELSATLLTRSKRHVELTDAGRLFLQEARDIVEKADRAAEFARRMGHTETPRLRLGVGYYTDQTGIAAVIRDFHARHHDIQVETRTMSVPSQLAALLDGPLDVGFVRPPIVHPALESAILIREPLVVALPRTHALASRARVSLAELANEPFVLPPRDTVPVFYDTVLKACRKAGFVPHVADRADHLHMILDMVAAHAGVAPIPASARRFKRGSVVCRSLHPAPDNLETAIAWRREDKSPMLAEFIRSARQTLHRERCVGRRVIGSRELGARSR